MVYCQAAHAIKRRKGERGAELVKEKKVQIPAGSFKTVTLVDCDWCRRRARAYTGKTDDGLGWQAGRQVGERRLLYRIACDYLNDDREKAGHDGETGGCGLFSGDDDW